VHGHAAVTATVDVRDAVDESDERDNAFRRLCGAR
jgi:subtilase family serine protease